MEKKRKKNKPMFVVGIITLEIVNWLGAVIVLGGRQFDESGVCFSEMVW